MADDEKQAAERLIRNRLDADGTQYESVRAVQKARDAWLVTIVMTDPAEEHKAVVTRDEIS